MAGGMQRTHYFEIVSPFPVNKIYKQSVLSVQICLLGTVVCLVFRRVFHSNSRQFFYLFCRSQAGLPKAG